MKKTNYQPIVIEVYTRVVDKTVEALDKYLRKSTKYTTRFNISQELKFRWQARLNFLFSSVEGSWANFFESQSKIKNFSKKNQSLSPFFSNENSNIIRNLNEYFFSNLKFAEDGISAFKPWLWYFVITRIAFENFTPIQIGLLDRGDNLLSENDGDYFKEEKNIKYGRGIFTKYSALLDQGHSLHSDHFFNWSISEKKLKKEIIGISSAISDSLGSDLEKEIESQLVDGDEEETPKNFILALTERVNRRNTKWRITLKDGILHMNEKDFLFNICKCEFFW
jgi:hypothetical protein